MSTADKVSHDDAQRIIFTCFKGVGGYVHRRGNRNKEETKLHPENLFERRFEWLEIVVRIKACPPIGGRQQRIGVGNLAAGG